MQASTSQPAPFLPRTRAEMARRGWDALDVLLVSGDGYVDHPSFGLAVIGRLLEDEGWRVGILDCPELEPDGAGWTGESRVLYQSAVPLPITDLVADANGELLLCTGGRGQRGGLFRLHYTGVVDADEPPVVKNTNCSSTVTNASTEPPSAMKNGGIF